MFGGLESDDYINRFVQLYKERTQAFVRKDVPRIVSVLRENLDLEAIPSGARIVCLGIGEGLEVLALRQVFPNASKMLGVDTQIPSTDGLERIESAGAIFEPLSAGNTTGIIRLLDDQPPDLVICRHPRIYKAIEGEGLVLTDSADRWAKILIAWGKIMTAQNGQLLVTTYFVKDRDLLAEQMHVAGLNPSTGESAYGYPVGEFADFDMKTDGFTLHVS